LEPIKRSVRLSIAALLATAIACGGGNTSQPPVVPTPTPPSAPAGPPKALEGATITITSAGLRLDAASAALYDINKLRVYLGARLMFINDDNAPHDILSGPFGLHNDCPELNTVGYLVPGQSRASDPLTHLDKGCGFHDHNREGNPAFGGIVTAESR
jgi:hypothetical protein